MASILEQLQPLIDVLRSDGYTVIGPKVSGEAIVLAELESAAELPTGWGVDLRPGAYRLRPRADSAAFGHSGGPVSWKSYLHPPRTQLFSVHRDGFVIEQPEPEPTRYAFLGVRPCDLRAIAIQGNVLGKSYARRHEAAFIVAVNCTEPGATCFCKSTSAGAGAGADLVITELESGFLTETASPEGEQLLARIPHRDADPAQVRHAQEALERARERMTRHLPEMDLRDLLAGARESPRWTQVAQRCLSCGNCTMVCPTCFCTTVEDTTDLSGDIAQRWQRWDSCFDLDFSYLHGAGPVRPDTRSRYRQWLTHKFGTWQSQFGESGCVGCGRCIVWCPAGIDVTEELEALAR